MVVNLNSLNSNNSKVKKCPKCGFDVHSDGANATKCEICSSFLDVKTTENSAVKDEQSTEVVQNNFLLNILFILQSLELLKSNKFRLKIISLPLLVLGVILAGSLIAVSNNLSNGSSETTPIDKQKETKISGLSSYGGDSIFAPLVANGLNRAIEAQHPNLQLRYAKPANGNFSSVNGIEMLLNGEISLAYNARPLTDDEYRKAQLRGFPLKQVPIAIDAIAVFSNFWTPTAGLTLQQVNKIFSGEITNWNQIDSKYESIPIIPIIVDHENYGAFDFKNFPTAIKLSSYTEVIKKVIETPGAISLASSSLVQNQRLTKIYSLADGNSSFISLFDNNKLNSAVIKTGEYPLTRRLYVVIREDDTNDSVTGKAITNYLISPPGQKIIEKSNYVPLY
jgi:phosphate transport system substrate-binding protein